MLQRIYNALSKNTLQDVELKKIQLSRVSDFIDEAEGQIFDAEESEVFIAEQVGRALNAAKTLNTDTRRAEGLVQDGYQILVDIQDLGLEAPPDLQAVLEDLEQLRDLDAQQIVNSLENVERIIAK